MTVGAVAPVPPTRRRGSAPWLVTAGILVVALLLLTMVPARASERTGDSWLVYELGAGAGTENVFLSPGSLCPSPGSASSGRVAMVWASLNQTPVTEITLTNAYFSPIYYRAANVSAGGFAFDLDQPATPCANWYVLSIDTASPDLTRITFETTFNYTVDVPIL
jgi:hypothetical protein